MTLVSWLYVDLNSFFASCEQQDNPKLRKKPVAVVPMMADSTSCIAASYEAKKFGVKTGTRVGDAKKMCPGLVLVQANHATYIKYHHKIIEAVETCAPIDSVMSVDEVAIRLTGSQQKPENAIKLAHKIKRALQENVGVAITCSIGIATNKYLAKVATDMQKPNGLTVLRKEDLPHKLYSLQPKDLPGIGFRMEQRLQALGITTIQQILSKKQSELKQIWGGIWGERMYLWLRGETVDLPPTRTKNMSHQHVLPPKERSSEGAHKVAKKLLTKLALRLRKGDYYTKNLGVSVKFIDSQPSYWERTCTFNELRDSMSLLHKLEKLWQDFPKNKKPLRVAVVFSDLVKQGFHQFSFFENPKRDELSKVMDKINQKYGRDALHLGATHEQKEAAPTRIAFRRIPDLDEF